MAPPGRRHLHAVTGDPDTDHPRQQERVPMAMPGDALPDPALIELVTRIQASFILRGQSLVDQGTADSYRITLDTVRLILEGAVQTGVIGEDQHTTLRGMVDAADQVPDLL